MFNRMLNRYSRLQSIQHTINALNSLPRTELDDLGISRYQINTISKQAICKDMRRQSLRTGL